MDTTRKIVIFEPNLIRDLQHQPHHLKLLYRILWELADPIGVVCYDRLAVSAMAGITYQEDDFLKFGKRIVQIGENELLMVNYLKTTVKVLSPKSMGQAKVWRLLRERYGATPENMEPFYDAWKKLDIRWNAPEMQENFHSDEESLKPWEVQFRAELDGALRVLNTPEIPEEIWAEMQQYVQKRVNECRKITQKSVADYRKITADTVIDLQRKVTRALRAGLSAEFIIEKIEDARIENRHTFNLEMPRFKKRFKEAS